jgi:hypothetical protein
MKRYLFTLLTASVLCTSLTASAFATSPTANAEKGKVIPQLEQQVHRLDWAAQSTKGSARALRELQSLRVKKLIQRLQAGEAVDPNEIDKLLNEQPWPQ